MMGRTAKALGALLALAAMYLLFWPVRIRPKIWRPPPEPGLRGPFAPNHALAKVVWLDQGDAFGPESTVEDAQGRIYCGTRDGRILRLSSDGHAVETFARTGGRPLGLSLDAAGNLIVCDAFLGLLSVSPTGVVSVLTRQEGGVPFRFTDDVDVGPDGTIYFTDASSKFGPYEYREDVLEHGGNGRFLAYHPETRTTERLMGGMDFANGVAVSGDGSYVLVNETGSYRIRRYWLAGSKKGSWDVFYDNLPGFPDNITYSKSRNAFWVALFAPRDSVLDALGPLPWARTIVDRLPEILQPAPKRYAFAVALDSQGRVVQNLQDPSPRSYAPVTSVREHGGYLYLGSLLRDAVGRLPAP